MDDADVHAESWERGREERDGEHVNCHRDNFVEALILFWLVAIYGFLNSLHVDQNPSNSCSFLAHFLSFLLVPWQ